ncbi:hypothetical protein [Nonomuraea angiospora]
MTFATPAVIRERQQAAADVMLKLLALDLPAISWQFTSIQLADAEHRGELEGQLSGAHYEEPAAVRAALDAWAAHFNTTPVPQSKDSLHIYVRGVVDGVKVDVWGTIEKPRKRTTKRALVVV